MVKIIGHPNTDADSLISMHLLQKLCKYLGIEAKCAIPEGTAPEGIVNLASYLGIDIHTMLSTPILPDEHIILVDHHETILKNEIDDIIDHHPDDTIPEKGEIILASSTAIMIYKRMLQHGYSPTASDVYMMLVATYIDTCSLMSSKFQVEDSLLINTLIDNYNFSRVTLYNIGLDLTNLARPMKDLANNDRKNHYFNKHAITSSCIQVNGPFDKLDFLLNYIQEKMKDSEFEIFACIITDFSTKTTTVYFIKSDSITVDFYDYVASRGINILPKLKQSLK